MRHRQDPNTKVVRRVRYREDNGYTIVVLSTETHSSRVLFPPDATIQRIAKDLEKTEKQLRRRS